MSLERITNSAVQWQTPVAPELQRQQQISDERPQPVSSPAYIVNLSAGSRSNPNAVDGPSEGSVSTDTGSSTAGAVSPQECETCKNRKYVDQSNDATVSFQAPTRLSPNAAESAVRAHEQEHVSSEQARAGQEGREVVSQTVVIHYAVCTECGRSYVSGGTTTTVTKAETKPAVSEGSPPAPSSGRGVDLRA